MCREKNRRGGEQMQNKDYLVAQSKDKYLYKDEEGYYFVEKVDIETAESWLESEFATIYLEMDDDVLGEMKNRAKENNQSLDSFVTDLLEGFIARES